MSVDVFYYAKFNISKVIVSLKNIFKFILFIVRFYWLIFLYFYDFTNIWIKLKILIILKND